MPVRKRIQWHPLLYVAVELDLGNEGASMKFRNECSLGRLPFKTDMLVIKKQGTVKNAAGALFRQYNLIEYKSPDDQMNISTYYKLLVYGILYMLQREEEGVLKNQITLTLIRDVKPYKLFEEFKREQFVINQKDPGVYYLTGNIIFPTQIIVSNELEGMANIWLKALSRRLDEKTAKQILDARGIINPEQSEEADAILDLAIQENFEVFQRVKEREESMNVGLRALMKDEIEEELSKTRDKAIAEGLAEGQAKGMAKGMSEGIAKGIEKGIEKGEAKNQSSTKKALKMILSGGYTAEVIAKETSLDLSYVKDLQAQLRS